MGDVVYLKSKEETEETIAGPAVCMHCGYEWATEEPVGTLWLECPNCELDKGVFKGPVLREEEHWKCNCGEGAGLFRITRTCIYCPMCGMSQNFA